MRPLQDLLKQFEEKEKQKQDMLRNLKEYVVEFKNAGVGCFDVVVLCQGEICPVTTPGTPISRFPFFFSLVSPNNAPPPFWYAIRQFPDLNLDPSHDPTGLGDLLRKFKANDKGSNKEEL